jgi:hypothetical protein
MPEKDAYGLRMSLVAVWVATALVSVLELEGQGRALLLASGVSDPQVANGLIYAGAAVDLVLGMLLYGRPIRSTYLLALFAMLGMTVVATVLNPGLWLHPLGPLLKNIPIAAVLWVLARKQA